jgi:hypothetical protein
LRPQNDASRRGPANRSARVPAERRRRGWRRKRVFIGGILVLAVIAVAGVFAAGRLLHSGSSDPGCQAYANTALPAYNKAVGVLNSQASQSTLGADMTIAVTDLTSAAQQAQSGPARSALGAMLTELKTVQADVASGSVPSAVVKALNADSTAADGVCS